MRADPGPAPRSTTSGAGGAQLRPLLKELQIGLVAEKTIPAPASDLPHDPELRQTRDRGSDGGRREPLWAHRLATEAIGRRCNAS